MDELYHHGIKGQKWGVKNGPPYPLGSDISTGKKLKTTFVSGSSKTQSKDSPYYREKLPSGVAKELDQEMKAGNKIIVGDAPGVDRQVQDYLKSKNYSNVEVYSPGKESRYLADKKWKNHLIDAPEFEPGSPEWLAKKDKAMQKAADKGIAVILDEGSKATRNNVDQLLKDNKKVSVYQLNPDGTDEKIMGFDRETAKKVGIILGVTAGVSLAALGGYALYKTQGVKYMRSQIPKGTTLQNLSEFKDRPLMGNSFYASFKKRDNLSYISGFGLVDISEGIKEHHGVGKDWDGSTIRKFKNISTVTDKMKVASYKDGQKAFSSVISKRPEFAKQLHEINQNSYHKQFGPEEQNKALRALTKLSKGEKVSKSEMSAAYRMFNVNIVDRRADNISKEVYKELQNKGFSAMVDLEDIMNSFAQMPIIVFDKSKYSLKSSGRLTEKEVKEATRILWQKYGQLSL